MEGLRITREGIEEYLDSRKRDGLKENTLYTYRAKLYQLYELLPEDKTIRRGTIKDIADQMHAGGYSTQAINVLLTTADNYVVWCGCPELQASTRFEVAESVQPEITRAEYMRLLSAAKILDRERDYLLVKTIVLTGINLTELLALTASDVESGWLMSGQGESRRIPDALREELLDYARRSGATEGLLFRRVRAGSDLTRGGVTHAIKGLARTARVDETKCNPRCLRKLYQDTQAQYREMVQALVDQAAERQLAKEQRMNGWNH